MAMDFTQLMDMAKDLREKLSQAQNESSSVQASGEAGGGLVKATVNGQHQLTDLSIDVEALRSQDATFVADLVLAAVNQANSRVGDALKTRLGTLAKTMGVPESMFDAMGNAMGGKA